jgi:hypothetical protein
MDRLERRCPLQSARARGLAHVSMRPRSISNPPPVLTKRQFKEINGVLARVIFVCLMSWHLQKYKKRGAWTALGNQPDRRCLFAGPFITRTKALERLSGDRGRDRNTVLLTARVVYPMVRFVDRSLPRLGGFMLGAAESVPTKTRQLTLDSPFDWQVGSKVLEGHVWGLATIQNAFDDIRS